MGDAVVRELQKVWQGMKSHGTGRACYDERAEEKCDDCREANKQRVRRWRGQSGVLQKEAEHKQRWRAAHPVRNELNQVRARAVRRKGTV